VFKLAAMHIDQDLLRVKPMKDGGMGSLAISPVDCNRKFGAVGSECHFIDLDGVPVSVSLNLDQHGAPFEIDVWKIDFSPLISWPAQQDLRSGPPNKSLLQTTQKLAEADSDTVDS
jgi:hypothetical protein